MCSGVPAAIASNCAWQLRSMLRNQNAASSTVLPTVNKPWFWWMAAFPVGNWATSSRPSSMPNCTRPRWAVTTTWSW